MQEVSTFEFIASILALLLTTSSLSWSITKLVQCIKAKAAQEALRAKSLKDAEQEISKIGSKLDGLLNKLEDIKVMAGKQQTLIENTVKLVDHHIEWCENHK